MDNALDHMMILEGGSWLVIGNRFFLKQTIIQNTKNNARQFDCPGAWVSGIMHQQPYGYGEGSGPKNVKFSGGAYMKSDMPESIDRC